METIDKKTTAKMEPIFNVECAQFYQPITILGTVKQSLTKAVATLTYDAKSQCLFVNTPDNRTYIVPFTNIAMMEYK